MSVIVEGFYKPKNCSYCPFNKSNCFCVLTDGGYINRDNWSCSATCPIKELPKGHGRLIDADALGEKLNKYTEAPYQYALTVFNGSPTIIEADKESEEK